MIDHEAVPILGIPGIEELGLLKRVYSMECGDPLQKILDEYEDVFKGLGKIKNVHHTIQLKDDARPIIHAPRRIPVSLRQPLKEELDRMVKSDVIIKIDKPTDWVNSMVIVKKKNNKLRICLDPSSLNKAIRREHFPLQTIEEVASRMPAAKYFTVLDANHGYWQVCLSEESIELCTFNTPYGRYAFKRLPFGICSAGEVFQKLMVQIFGGTEGVEVIVDDLLVWGTTRSEHDQRLREVLQRAREHNIRLNPDKSQICKTSVTYVGHTLSGEGLTPDKRKIEAIEKMNYSTSKEELQRYLGIITYLSKFIPNMSKLSSPLRELLEKNVEFHWHEQHSTSFDQLKRAITTAPVLRYFDSKLPIVLSGNASSKGLGAVILQESRPVAYASRALSKSECNYAQIEKETLAIAFACKRFHDYLYGHECTLYFCGFFI